MELNLLNLTASDVLFLITENSYISIIQWLYLCFMTTTTYRFCLKHFNNVQSKKQCSPHSIALKGVMKIFSSLLDFLGVDLWVSKRLFYGVFPGVRVGNFIWRRYAINSPTP